MGFPLPLLGLGCFYNPSVKFLQCELKLLDIFLKTSSCSSLRSTLASPLGSISKLCHIFGSGQEPLKIDPSQMKGSLELGSSGDLVEGYPVSGRLPIACFWGHCCTSLRALDNYELWLMDLGCVIYYFCKDLPSPIRQKLGRGEGFGRKGGARELWDRRGELFWRWGVDSHCRLGLPFDSVIKW